MIHAVAQPGLSFARLSFAARRRKDRQDWLVQQIRFDRAYLYDRVGSRAQARREFERLNAEIPDFDGLKARLDL
jgi:lipoprotein NlpI